MDAGILHNLFGLLVIALIFYLVIRKTRKGGCCGHSKDENDNKFY